MEPKMKFFYPKVKGVDKENRRITVCISKSEIDRHNERIEIIAIADSLQVYAANPVVLGDHQHRLSSGQSSVIGHAPPESFKLLPDEVDMDIVFSTTENAETYWINYRDDHQKAVSIGFIDLEWRRDEEEGNKIYVSTKIELLELSCVAVGANRGALVKVKGMFDRTKDSPAEQNSDVLKEISNLKSFIETELDEIKTLLADPDGFAEHLMLGKDSDSSVPAGDTDKSERILEVLNEIKTKL